MGCSTAKVQSIFLTESLYPVDKSSGKIDKDFKANPPKKLDWLLQNVKTGHSSALGKEETISVLLITVIPQPSSFYLAYRPSFIPTAQNKTHHSCMQRNTY